MRMGCWRWFDGVLKEAGVEVTDANRERTIKVWPMLSRLEEGSEADQS